MTDKKPDGHAQLHVDLWMHQNNLLWGRYATLLQLQAAIIAGAYAIHFGATKPTAITAMLAVAAGTVGAILTMLLWNVTKADMQIRDGHARRLHGEHDLDPSRPTDKQAVYHPDPNEILVHRSVIWSFTGVDAVIAILALFDVERLWSYGP